MAEETPAAKQRTPLTPEQIVRRNRIFLIGCAVFFLLLAVTFAAYALDQYRDYDTRTSPPGGVTTTTTVDDVDEGRYCSASGKTSNCSPEYTLSYTVDGETHESAIRKHVHTGDTVHAFQGSDGKWYVTEDPGYGNSEWAWVIWSAIALAPLIFAGFCLRGLRKFPKAR